MPNPSTYPNATFWQPTLPSLIWTGAVGSVNVAAVDDLIQNAETQISSRVLTQATGTLKPKWKGDGWYWFGDDGGNLRRAGIASILSVFNHLHRDALGHILVRFKVDTVDANFKVIVANCRLTTAHTGFGVRVSSDGSVRLLIYNNGTVSLTLSAGTVADTNEHVAEFVLSGTGSNAIKGRLDWGSWTTGTVGALAAGNATDDFTMGARPNAIEPFNGQIRDLVIASSELPDQYVFDWRNRLFGGGDDDAGLSLGLGLGI